MLELLLLGYRVSCLAASVTEARFYGIDLFTEDRRVFTRGPGLVGNPVTPCDVIRVYTKMNENFKGGINNVMRRSNDPVDSRFPPSVSGQWTSLIGTRVSAWQTDPREGAVRMCGHYGSRR